MEDRSGQEPVVDTPVQMNIEISRGPTSEIAMTDIEPIKQCLVFDGDGQQVTIDQLCSNRKTILIFIRHFLCYACIEYVEDLALIGPKVLEGSGVQLLVIGCAPWRFIKKFNANLNCPHQIYCDPDQKIHKILQLKTEKYIGRSKESKHVKSGLIAGMMKSTWSAWQSMEWQGDPQQQGGAMVIDADGRILFSHKDENAMAHCSIISSAVPHIPPFFP